MKTLLRETLESLGYPVYLQGSMADDEAYPKSFITYLSMDSYNEADFDDKTHAVGWRFQVAFYSADPLLIDSVPQEIRRALKAVGFIPTGRGRDLPSDEPTHTGWVQEYYILENFKED